MDPIVELEAAKHTKVTDKEALAPVTGLPPKVGTKRIPILVVELILHNPKGKRESTFLPQNPKVSSRWPYRGGAQKEKVGVEVYYAN